MDKHGQKLEKWMAWHNYRFRGNNTTKYHNSKIIIDGKRFDSKKEAYHYTDLKLRQQCGEISDLQMQVKFVLIPTQKNKDGKVVERECAYYADFVYLDNDRHMIVEDVKSPITRKNPEYIIKRKLLLYLYGIHITEV